MKVSVSRRPKRIDVIAPATRGHYASATFFASERFTGDLEAQIEQYFTSQLTEMQITVTTHDLCSYFRV
jgi:hypothetical protein